MLPCRDRLGIGAVGHGEGDHDRVVEPAELVGLLRGQLACGDAGHPQQPLLPGRGAAAEGEHVVCPQPMPAMPAARGVDTQPHRDVKGPLAQAAVAQDQNHDPDGAQPQRNTQQRKDRPDHDAPLIAPLICRRSGVPPPISLRVRERLQAALEVEVVVDPLDARVVGEAVEEPERPRPRVWMLAGMVIAGGTSVAILGLSARCIRVTSSPLQDRRPLSVVGD